MKFSNIIPRLKHKFNYKAGRVVDPQGNQYWYFSNFKLHREKDQPAVINLDGTKEWWKFDKRHRENGLPAIEGAAGTREWWVENERHRENGPAVEKMDGTKEWWVKGKRHRDDGPAVENADGTKEWYLNGEVWAEGARKAPEIREQKIDQIVQDATTVDQGVVIMPTIKFKKIDNKAPGL